MNDERKGSNGQAQPNEEPRERKFFDLVRMTKEFSLWDEQFIANSDDEIADDAREMTPQEAAQVRQRRRMNDLQAWQARGLIVLAQQQLIMNSHLKKLVELLERRQPAAVPSPAMPRPKPGRKTTD